MPRIQQRFTDEAASLLRAAIVDAGGNEVFCLGTVISGKVTEIRVLARGNRHATPAILKVPRPGEVVIHNHPSGLLTPSDADLQISSQLGNEGVGSFLVDNDVREVYVIVEPHIEERTRPIAVDQVRRLFAPDGSVSRALNDYESRPQQLAMIEAVVKAFNDDEVLCVEAGTGTGKSLAYLVPAILWSRLNKERVIVSTHTINLQEQLVQKDLPFLVDRVGLECSVALVKGRGNYLCRRKAAQLEEQGQQLIEDDIRRELNEILAWSKRTRDGSLGDLAVKPRPEVWEQVISENDNCLRARCPFYSSCFFYTARRAAAAADIVVVNHHLLMADLALREELGSYTQNAVLPPAKRVIIDEAHHLEDVATAYFGHHVSLAMIQRTLGRLRSGRHEGKGVLPALRDGFSLIKDPADQDVVRGATDWIEQRLLPQRLSVAEAAEEAFAQVLTEFFIERAGNTKGSDDKLRILPDTRATRLWRNCLEQLGGLADRVNAYADDFEGVLDRIDMLSTESEKHVLFLGTEFRALQGRLRGFAEALNAFTADGDEECRWIECRERKDGPVLSFHVAPIEVNELLRRSLFEPFGTVILTSATLAVDKRFEYLHKRAGIDRLEITERSSTLLVESPFDYPRQALLAVPSDLPEPTSKPFEAATQAVIHQTLEITRGGTFVLFTSYGALNRAVTAFEPIAAQLRITVLKQGITNRAALLARFVREPRAVLFATDSFWEGVDVKGDALRCVLIARLPFKVPTEPIEQARLEAIEERGGNPFVEHTVPQAVIKLKQGFGRLIRSRQDRGAVIILDPRVVTKRYGRTFLDSLPPARRVIGATDVVMTELRKSFGPPQK